MNVRPCALIVEDELFVALDLEDAMVEMGFYVWVWRPHKTERFHWQLVNSLMSS